MTSGKNQGKGATTGGERSRRVDTKSGGVRAREGTGAGEASSGETINLMAKVAKDSTGIRNSKISGGTITLTDRAEIPATGGSKSLILDKIPGEIKVRPRITMGGKQTGVVPKTNPRTSVRRERETEERSSRGGLEVGGNLRIRHSNRHCMTSLLLPLLLLLLFHHST